MAYACGLVTVALALVFWRSPFMDETLRTLFSRGNPPKYRHPFRLRRPW